MAGYIGKSQGVTQVDGYTRDEADAEYANIAGDTFTGSVTVDATSASPLTLDRNSTDGNIVTLQKDGTTVGSIGTTGGIVHADSAGTAVGIQLGGVAVLPRKSGALNDAGVDLGSSSRRFKDAYLSGGIYLGGTSSVNHLDDYEEGTFTVSSTRAGVGEDSGGWIAKYVKIGRLVHVTISTNTWVRHFGSGYNSGQTFQINTNLPFVPSGQGGGRVAHTRSLANREFISLAWTNGSSAIYLNECGSNNSFTASNNVTTNTNQTNITLTFSGSYYTTN